MDFTNIKDPAGINALLDSLRSSSVFALEKAAETSTANSEFDAPPASDEPESETNDSGATEPTEPTQPDTSGIPAHVAALLARLDSSTPSSDPRSGVNEPASQSTPAVFSPPSPSRARIPADARSMTFQQALPHVGRLLEDPEIMTTLRRMKIEQNELEQRLWMGREAILASQKKKVDDALAVMQLTQTAMPFKERDNMKIEFERELERYDRHRILPAWDHLLAQQQEKLEALGFPTFFPTTSAADRARQQRLTCAGVIFGYAALKPVLIKKGVYQELCDPNEEEWPECTEQDLRLNFMFTLSAVVTNVFALPIGILLDYAGPRNTSLLGALCFGLGCFFFGLQTVTSHIDSYYVGYVLLAIGGPLIFLSQFHLSNTFPKHSGLVLSLIVGAFDCSSFPFLIYRALDDKFDITIRAWFWSYLVIPVLLIIQQLTIAPSASYKQTDFEESAPILSAPPVPDSHLLDDENPMRGMLRRRSSARPSFGVGFTTKNVDARPELEVPAHFDDPLMGAMAASPLKAQLMSSYYLAIVFFLCVYMCRINYEIQTVTSQMIFYLSDRDLAGKIATTFTILLPVGGVVGIPIIGALLDRQGSGPTSMVVLAMGILYGVLGIVPHAAAQLVAIGVFVILRPLMYTFMGDYTGKAFGFETFGTVYGLLNCIAGLSGLILRPVDVFVKGMLHGNYTVVNVVGLVLGAVSAGLVTWRIYRRPMGGIALLEDDEDEILSD